MKRWIKPDFESIEMNAEIGGYQSDFVEPRPSEDALEQQLAATLETDTGTRTTMPVLPELADSD